MITGKQLRDAFISGANYLSNRREEVDALNVFPVPDGDTGTNMSMTFQSGAEEMKKIPDDATISEVSKKAASAFLRGARGNSGVILSLLFRGVAQGLRDKETAVGSDIAAAAAIGIEAAYKAVMKPTEGTILTVARMASEKAGDIVKYDESVSAVLYGMYMQAKRTLAETPEMLPILKKSGVVDAGGQGLVYILEGIWRYVEKGVIVPLESETEEAEAVSVSFAYDTELVIERSASKKDPDELRKFLCKVGTIESFIFDDITISVRSETNDPGKIITEALTFGALRKVSVENTELSGAESVRESVPAPAKAEFEYKPVDDEIPYGFVSVVAGSGLTDIFKDLGCDNVVSGGQTMNPSTEDILAAVQATPAKTVFVLPNNKNIIMAANQAADIADRKVIVIPSRTVPQGISAMLAFSLDLSAADNADAMNDALSTVSTGSITFAARDSDFDGIKINEGELLALKEGKMIYTGVDITLIARRLAKELISKDTSIVTIYYGSDVTPDQAEVVKEAVESRVSKDIEVNVVYGGQPVYYYILSAE